MQLKIAYAVVNESKRLCLSTLTMNIKKTRGKASLHFLYTRQKTQETANRYLETSTLNPEQISVSDLGISKYLLRSILSFAGNQIIMTDVFSSEQRSAIMRSVKSKQNISTEIRLIKCFNEFSIRGWRRNYNVIGHPDFVFPTKRIAVFVDGCFWHGHDCRNTHPSSNQAYWDRKIARNIKHDREITERFKKRGWTVIRIWECELKKKNRDLLISKLQPVLAKDAP